MQEALDRVMVGRTTVVVAHRLSTIRNADVIAVVHGGRIAETGTHEQLMANPHSTYASLVQLQEAGHLQPRPSFSESGSMGRPLRYFVLLVLRVKCMHCAFFTAKYIFAPRCFR